jgi:predicted DNA-binding transcriptional regulator YafY
MPRNTNSTINDRKQALLDFLPNEHSGSQGCTPDELKAWVARQEPAVSYKTIERDLKELLAQQSVIQHIDGKRYRWLRAAGVRSSQPMRRDEAFLHELARRRLAHLLPSSLFSTLQASLDEAKKVLDRPDLQRERSWFRKVITVPALLPPP